MRTAPSRHPSSRLSLQLLALLAVFGLTTIVPVAPASAASATRTASFAYDPATGLLIQEVIEPDTPALRLQTDYTYDGYGNKLTATVSGVSITTRTTSITFDSRGQFPGTTSNALNQSETKSFDARFGSVVSLTGPNGLTTSWSYDGFGRKLNEIRADATQTNIAYNPCNASCPALAKYFVVSTTAGSPSGTAYYDLLQREIRSQVQGFDGRLVTKDTEYDSRGRVLHVSRPYYAGDTVYRSTASYDALNRVIQEIAPDNSVTTRSYNGLTTTTTNSLNQTETRVKNSQGQLIRATRGQ